jgi:hypothetical protein
MRATIICCVLLASAIPLAKTGSCPSGYASEASWCVLMKNAPVAVPKGAGQCYCIEKQQRR